MAFYHSTKFPILWRSEYRTPKKWKHLTNFSMFCIQMLGIICFVLYSDAFKLTDQLMIEQMFVIWSPEKSVVQGQDSLRLNLYYLSLWLAVFQSKTLLVEKTVSVELGESWPRSPQYSSAFRRSDLNRLSHPDAFPPKIN